MLNEERSLAGDENASESDDLGYLNPRVVGVELVEDIIAEAMNALSETDRTPDGRNTKVNQRDGSRSDSACSASSVESQ